MNGSPDLINLFVEIGLSESKAKETAKNGPLSEKFKSVIEEAKTVDGNSLSRSTVNLLYNLVAKLKNQILQHCSLLVNYIVTKKINSDDQLNAALSYLLDNPDLNVDVKSFDEEVGVGVVVTSEQIEDAVTSVVAKYKEAIKLQRYSFNVGILMGEVRKMLKWADGNSIKTAISIELLDLIGPKTEEDSKPTNKQAANKSADKTVTKQTKTVQSTPTFEAVSFTTEGWIDKNGKLNPFIELAGHALHFHKPGENYKTEGYVITPKTMDLLKKHLELTKGQVVTRFPPEPNGILHIGHAKAINFNFGFARAHEGVCYLRYDDTNPEKEEEKFFVGIKDMVEWLGYTPFKITHSSDYFQELYDFAVELIERDLAYVCHQSSEEMKGKDALPSLWRNRPREESLRLFEDMRKGKINEGEATLRMKITLEEGKQDPVAYRIKFTPHHRTGDKWCIYPTYDYTHCLCDSIENITHSLCTKEFQSRRSSYYWLCNALDLYCPVQWEYGRLNLHYTVVSKRKIAKLIEEKIVRDWDDPRLFTLTSLRRRGFPPEAINMFCGKVGVSMAQAVLDPSMLENCVRDVLNVTAPRVMAVLSPLKVTISNLPSDFPKILRVPDFPSDETKSHRDVSFSNTIFIDRDDFKEEADKNFKRLTGKQPVGLKYANLVISVREIIKDESGEITELIVVCHKSSEVRKPKGHIQWVSDGVTCEVRMYERLFMHKNPEDKNEVPGGFVTDCNTNSLNVITCAMVEKSVTKAKVLDGFQFERIGFFVVDPDTSDGKIVFNLTVTLKEGQGKI